MNLSSYLEMWAREQPNETAVIEGEREISFKELDETSTRIGAWLSKEGISQGDRVAIFLPNIHQYLTFLFGTWKVGAVAVLVNYRFKEKEVQYVLENSESKTVVGLAKDLDLIRFVGPAVKSLRGVVVVGGTSKEEDGFVGYEEVIAGDLIQLGSEFKAVPVLDTHDACLMYTSGTTGKPKGVRQTHRNCGAEVEATVDAWHLTTRDRLISVSPLFHVAGLQVCSLAAIRAGAAQVMLPQWNATQFLELVQKWKVRWTLLVGTMMVDLVNLPGAEAYDVSSLRFCAAGGSPIPPSLYERFEKKFGVKMLEVYGQTEQAGMSVAYYDWDGRRGGAMGVLLQQAVEGRVVDAKTKLPVELGQEGELWVRGDIVTPGYWNLPEEDGKKFVDGWLRTGDIVRMDGEGYLYFVERNDDLIVTGAEKVYPREVENFLCEHPAVAEAAVVGLPDERLGQIVTAAIVPRGELTEEEILLFCRNTDKLAGYKRPRKIYFVKELPKTASRKVSKATLRQVLASPTAVAGSTEKTPTIEVTSTN